MLEDMHVHLDGLTFFVTGGYIIIWLVLIRVLGSFFAKSGLGKFLLSI